MGSRSAMEERSGSRGRYHQQGQKHSESALTNVQVLFSFSSFFPLSRPPFFFFNLDGHFFLSFHTSFFPQNPLCLFFVSSSPIPPCFTNLFPFRNKKLFLKVLKVLSN